MPKDYSQAQTITVRLHWYDTKIDEDDVLGKCCANPAKLVKDGEKKRGDMT